LENRQIFWNIIACCAFHALHLKISLFGLTASATDCHLGRNLMAVILIVDDEVFIRAVTEMMVHDLGHQTLVAGDLDEALIHLQSSQHIDALFTDIRLKSIVLGGVELAHKAISLRPNLRVLYTTGSSMTETMRASFVEGAHFMQKPYAQDQLQNSMEKLLAASP
jgi:DNA-binding NtrC family response regulator